MESWAENLEIGTLLRIIAEKARREHENNFAIISLTTGVVAAFGTPSYGEQTEMGCHVMLEIDDLETFDSIEGALAELAVGGQRFDDVWPGIRVIDGEAYEDSEGGTGKQVPKGKALKGKPAYRITSLQKESLESALEVLKDPGELTREEVTKEAEISLEVVLGELNRMEATGRE